jgi:hypothetical protein
MKASDSASRGGDWCSTSASLPKRFSMACWSFLSMFLYSLWDLEIIRRQYQRGGSRYASDVTDGGVVAFLSSKGAFSEVMPLG